MTTTQSPAPAPLAAYPPKGYSQIVATTYRVSKMGCWYGDFATAAEAIAVARQVGTPRTAFIALIQNRTKVGLSWA